MLIPVFFVPGKEFIVVLIVVDKETRCLVVIVQKVAVVLFSRKAVFPIVVVFC